MLALLLCTCTSYSIFQGKEGMKGVYFIPLPKPSQDAEKFEIWLKACSGLNFDISSITPCI